MMKKLIYIILVSGLFLSCAPPKTTQQISKSISAQKTEPTRKQIEKLIKKLNASPAGKKAAREKLLEIGKPAVPLLIEALKERDFSTRWGAVNVLGYINDKTSLPALLERVLTDNNNHVRWRAIWAINQMKDENLTSTLRNALNEKDKTIRWNAAIALSTLDDKEAVPIILNGLHTGSSWVKWEAINALGRIHNKDTVDALIPFLNASDVRIRQETTLSLGKISGKKATQALIGALSDENSGVRWRAGMSLARIGDKSALFQLEKVSKKEKNQFAKNELEKALKELKLK